MLGTNKGSVGNHHYRLHPYWHIIHTIVIAVKITWTKNCPQTFTVRKLIYITRAALETRDGRNFTLLIIYIVFLIRYTMHTQYHSNYENSGFEVVEIAIRVVMFVWILPHYSYFLIRQELEYFLILQAEYPDLRLFVFYSSNARNRDSM
jgi:hypothetical protein